MKQFFFPVLIILLCLVNHTYAQDIYTFAGVTAPAGAPFPGDGGPAVFAHLDFPAGIVTDRFGNVYFADEENNRVRKVNAAGIITTVAGHAYYAGSIGDGGPADSAQLVSPEGIALDTAGNLYIADWGNNRIRKVDAITGIITTIAGNGDEGYSGDGGAAIAAALDEPAAIAINKATGNIYISDSWNNVIRMINPSGIITTVAGSYSAGFLYGGDGGPALDAFLYRPRGLALDAAGNLYIGDTYNYVVRRIDSSGIITTIAGNHTISGYSGDGGPATSATFFYPQGIATDDSGNIFIADGSPRLRVINAAGIVSTYAGNGTLGYSGDGGHATEAQINYVTNVALDTAHNVYLADGGNKDIRRIGGAVTGITIRSNTGDTACYNTLTGFTATAIADTFAPHYQWIKNGIYAGSDNAVYTPTTFATGDEIKCLLYNSMGDTLAVSGTMTIDSFFHIGPIVCPSVFCLGSVAQVYDDFSIFTSDFYSFRFFSTDTNVVSLSASGYYGLFGTAKSLGMDTFYFTGTNECGTDSVHQVVSVVSNTLMPINGPDSICAGSYVTYADASPGGEWNLFYPDPAHYSIDSSTGVFHSDLLIAGPFVITYGAYGCTVTDTPYIEGRPYPIGGHSSVEVYGSIYMTDLTPGGTWSSTTNTIATIDPVTGILFGVSPGVDTIYYSVTYDAGCTFFTKTLVNVVPFTGVVNTINSSSFTVFPNPASAQVTISWIAKNEGNGFVSVTDISGKQVMSESIEMSNANSAVLDISKLVPGIYLLSIRTDNSYYYSKLEMQ